MSYKVEIIETNNKLEISSSVNEQAPTIDIVQQGSPNISIVHDIALLPSDFNDNTESVIKSFLRSGYGVSLFPSGDYLLVQTSGLQPSGNYSLNGHNHSSLDITDFNSSVSGLLPVKNIVSGSGISVSSNNSIFTVAVTGQFGLTAEQVDDRVSSLLSSGYGINLSYDDNNNLLTISTVGLQPTGNYSLIGHSHVINDVSGLQNILDNKAALVHTHSAEAIVSGTLGFNRLPFTVTYPVRAVHVGGMIAFNNFSEIISPAYYWNGTYGDLQTLATMQFPDTSVYVDVSQSVTKYLNDYPGRTLTYASLEVVLIDAANRIVGWGTTASNPAPNPSNGTAGTSMTISLLSFPQVSNTWVIGGLPTSGTNTIDILPITAYKKVASRYLDINKYDWNNVVNPPTTYAPSSHSHGNITNAGTIGSQNNQILITSTSGLITTTSNIPSTQISGFDVRVSGFVQNIYAPLYSPAFSGIPTAPTATSGTSSSQIANTQFVRNEISNLINSAPSTLDTLNELASALGNDPNFATTIASGLGSKANLSGASFTGGITAPSGDFNSLKQNGVMVSTSGHKHYSNDILDFNSSVSGLLPVKNIVSGNNITISATSGQFTVAVTGLQPSGNYSTVGHSHVISDVSGLQNTLDSKQPSGNYTIVGHSHTSSDISNFNNSVSGLLPVTNILAGTNISVVPSGTSYTVSVSGQLGLTSEEVDDRVAALLNAGNGININYNDPLDTLIISTTGLQPSGDYASTVHSHAYTDITNFSSGVADNLTTTLLPGSFINLDYNLTLDTLTISTSGLQPSGNYSVIGHSHTSSDITNFNSSVSGLLPTVANSGSNRLLTSTGATTGLSAQPNLTFNGSLLNVTGSGVFASGLNLSNQTASTIASFDANKNITSLSTSSYPSLTELSYVKGVTGSLQTQLDLKSNLNSPSFTGTPTVPTAASGTNSNQIASTSFVRTEISNLVASAPSTLDTLNELATALGNDPNFATTVTNNLAGKANLSGATFTGNVSAPTGNFVNKLTLNNIDVSVSGHSHILNDITNINGNRGDITVSSSGLSWTINNSAVTYSKIQNVSTTDRILGRSSAGSGAIEEIVCTNFARTILDDTDAITARTTLGLTIGTNVQAYNQSLQSISSLSPTNDTFIYATGLNSYTTGIITAFGRSLLDDINSAAGRQTLELGSISVQNNNNVNISGGLINNVSCQNIYPISNNIQVIQNNTKNIDYFINITTNGLTEVFNITDENGNELLTEDGFNITTEDNSTISFIVPNNSIWQFNIKINCINQTDNLSASFSTRGCIKNTNNILSFIDSQIKEMWKDTGMENTDVVISNNNGMQVKLNGLANKQILWGGVLTITELTI